eukprot:m.329482 g.329482  ORF g.329482 m.329482 type:complete len:649 (+) comp16567_c0_seq21:325-2271(+)
MAEKKKHISNRKWFWKKNLTMKDKNKKAWKRYDDTTSAKLDEGFEANPVATNFVLNDTYCINFQTKVQYRTEDEYKQRPIRWEGGEEPPKKKQKAQELRTWFWKKNLSMKDSNKKAWMKYDDTMSQILTKGFKKDPTAKDYPLDATFSVNFADRFQFRTEDAYRQRPIKFALDAASADISIGGEDEVEGSADEDAGEASDGDKALQAEIASCPPTEMNNQLFSSIPWEHVVRIAKWDKRTVLRIAATCKDMYDQRNDMLNAIAVPHTAFYMRTAGRCAGAEFCPANNNLIAICHGIPDHYDADSKEDGLIIPFDKANPRTVHPVTIWKLANQKTSLQLVCAVPVEDVSDGEVCDIAWEQPYGNRLAVAQDCGITVWDVRDAAVTPAKLVSTFTCKDLGTSQVNSISWESQAPYRLAACIGPKEAYEVVIFDAGVGTIVCRHKFNEDASRSMIAKNLSWAPCGAPRLLLSFFLLSIPVGKDVELLAELPGEDRISAWHPDGNHIVVANTYNSVMLDLNSIKDGEYRCSMFATADKSTFAFSPCGKWMVCEGYHGDSGESVIDFAVGNPTCDEDYSDEYDDGAEPLEDVVDGSCREDSRASATSLMWVDKWILMPKDCGELFIFKVPTKCLEDKMNEPEKEKQPYSGVST